MKEHPISPREVLQIVDLIEVLEMCNVTQEEALTFLINNGIVELPPLFTVITYDDEEDID